MAPLRLAHRGDWRAAPENTLAALLAAARNPDCDGVELDVRLSRDGVPVVLHDETLARVQRRPVRVDALDAAGLARHDVPTLAAVLEALPAVAFLDIELKGDDHGDATAQVLREGRGEAPFRAVVSSFEPPALVAMAGRLPGWPRWLNADDLSPATLALALGLGCSAVSSSWGAITPASIARARAAGLDVAAWTVRRRATAARLARLGVVALCVEGAALGPAADPARTRRPRTLAAGDDGRRTGAEAMTAVDGDGGELVLEAGDARLVVAPGDGGRIASFLVGSRELLWTRREDGPIYWGCYPMAPWAGRIRHGTFAFAGQQHRLPLTMPPHAIHGVVFDRAWRVDDDRTISTDLAAPWPFPGRVVQRFDLAAGRLDVSLEVHADQPMPVVVGWHPWFRRVLAPGGAPASPRFAAREMLVRDAEGMPSGRRVPTPPGPWDDAFTGVAEPPVIEWPGALRLEITSSCDWWVVYDERDYALCVEPQSGPPDAVNLWPGAATLVAPGTPLVHRMTWRWERLQPAGG